MRASLPILAVILLSGCARVIPPAPAPAPRVPLPAPRPAPSPAPLSSDWRDWPLTPGTWRYAGGEARFGAAGATPSVIFSCNRSGGAVLLKLPAQPGGIATVRSTAATRAVTFATTQTGDAMLQLPARDPLLDAMGFSRGRFIIEPAGRAPLVIPAWPEVLRVVEDCRR
jgi:hypothetical protein